ncbi:hypothetical protein FEM48_Zijuj05G0074200 [Ziziphus jujuba var. spinosa]|uniref:Transcription factor MYB98-like n=1 Tax=Ziziphus jujuba var. spinosa TaxID=714518 RepID=A0A978VDL8_ZIZJJ|nr:hypothetical protein FEM48_Zijuj05G0074200 [Ziziphus jujuba var. spinosa]
MELDDKVRENNVYHHPSLLSNQNYMKPYNMKDHDFPFEASSSKGDYYFQDFHHLDDQAFHVNGSSSGPIFGSQSQTPCFDIHHPCDPYYIYDVGPTNPDQFYECKPFVENGGHGQVMDNFQVGGYSSFSSRNPMDMIGPANSSCLLPFNFHGQEIIKPVNFVVPDEVSCITAENGYYKKVGMNKSRTSMVTRKTCKTRKKSNVVKGQWTIEEDRLLIQLVEEYGVRKWSHIAQMLAGRIGKQCRERWHNHLRPDIKKDIWSEEEDKILIEAHAEIGNKWAEIAKRLPGRTENSIKNHWNATKRRQYSKRKCRSKYPRGSLLQDYIKSLNLDSSSNKGGRYQRKTTTTTTTSSTSIDIRTKAPETDQQNSLEFCPNNRLVPSCYGNFDEDPDEFCFDENIFQEGCAIESLLDDMPAACAPDLDAGIKFPFHPSTLEDNKFSGKITGDIDQKNCDTEMPEMDGVVAPVMKSEVLMKKEMDLVEMISKVNEADK